MDSEPVETFDVYHPSSKGSESVPTFDVRHTSSETSEPVDVINRHSITDDVRIAKLRAHIYSCFAGALESLFREIGIKAPKIEIGEHEWEGESCLVVEDSIRVWISDNPDEGWNVEMPDRYPTSALPDRGLNWIPTNRALLVCALKVIEFRLKSFIETNLEFFNRIL